MLTESEQKWLKTRKRKDDLYLFCKHCTVSPNTDDCYWNHVVEACPMYPNNEDAAKFSEQVAVKLAITGDDWDFEDMPCRGDERQYMRINCKLRKNHWECADCYLKAARLAVEEEMND